MAEGSLTNLVVLTAAKSAGRAVETRTGAIPWYIWGSIAAITSAKVGGEWDISWHMSIGRDAFLTPPHVMIYLCGVLAGITCGYLILRTTFDPNSRQHTAEI